MRHHAIIVTSWDKKSITAAHQKASELFGELNFSWKGNDGKITEITEITPEVTNGYMSFLISPDGSKEWRVTSDRGNNARSKFINWLTSHERIYCNYAEVQFADDEGDNRLLRSS